jgi:SH3-like domain-containing protein
VFARKGPGKDYQALFVYHAQGLPVQVVDETTDWRRICDPTGALVWVHRSMVDGRRTVMALGPAPLALRAQPQDGAPVAAWLRPRSVAALGGAQDGFREVSAAGAKGWVKPDEVWGLARGAQCSLSGGFSPANGAQ